MDDLWNMFCTPCGCLSSNKLIQVPEILVTADSIFWILTSVACTERKQSKSISVFQTYMWKKECLGNLENYQESGINAYDKTDTCLYLCLLRTSSSILYCLSLFPPPIQWLLLQLSGHWETFDLGNFSLLFVNGLQSIVIRKSR